MTIPTGQKGLSEEMDMLSFRSGNPLYDSVDPRENCRSRHRSFKVERFNRLPQHSMAAARFSRCPAETCQSVIGPVAAIHLEIR